MILLRLTIGLILLAHGIPKLFMIAAFVKGPVSIHLGEPLNWIVGLLVIAIEIIGGVLLLVGWRARLAGLVNAVLFAGIAFVYHFQHIQHIFNLNPMDGQIHFEFSLLLAAGSLAIYFKGPGWFALKREDR